MGQVNRPLELAKLPSRYQLRGKHILLSVSWDAATNWHSRRPHSRVDVSKLMIVALSLRTCGLSTCHDFIGNLFLPCERVLDKTPGGKWGNVQKFRVFVETNSMYSDQNITFTDYAAVY